MPTQHSNYFSIGGLIFLVILSKNEENREEKKRKEGETKMESKLKKYEKKERKQRKTLYYILPCCFHILRSYHNFFYNFYTLDFIGHK